VWNSKEDLETDMALSRSKGWFCSFWVVCRDLFLYLNHWRREMLVDRMLGFSVRYLGMTSAFAVIAFSKIGASGWE